MKVSKKWINQFVNIDDIPIREFCEKMTLTGSKVEKYEEEFCNIKNVVVGKVLNIEKHSDAEKLLICSIDVGKEEKLQIVTGAQNLKIGDIVPVALDGSVLADGTKIKKGKLRGILSQGMLCSLGELGLNLADFPYAVQDGIFVLKEETFLGQPIKQALAMDDTMIEFEITPNRPDCLSVLGIAREAAVTFERKMQMPKVEEKCFEQCNEFNVKNMQPELCKFYSARMIKDVKIAPSPKWLREKLRVVGIKPKNNIVDITNYVMVMIGQPMHAFDFEKISGETLNIRLASENERVMALDGNEYTLKNSSLVIADKEKILAIAGIMGAQQSAVSAETKCVILESANFKGQNVRATSKYLNLRTASSGLFEKGLDENLCILALNLAVQLIEKIGAGKACGNNLQVGKINTEKNKVKFEPEKINDFLGTQISKEQMIEILEKLEINLEGEYLIMPSFRQDISLMQDIAEEIARIYGYDNIKSNLPISDTCGKFSKEQKFEQEIIKTMLGLGFSEVTTFSFISPKNYEKLLLPQESEKRNCVKISNPLGEDTSVMRTTLLPSVLEVISRNFNNKNSNINIFEIAKEYLPQKDQQLPQEKTKLIAACYGKNQDFFSLKGKLEELFNHLEIKKYEFSSYSDSPSLHPGRCAQIFKDSINLGIIAQIHPKVLENFQIGTPVYMFELDFKELFNIYIQMNKTFKAPPRFPAVTRDLALVVPTEMPAQELLNLIEQNSNKILESVEVFDVYTGDQVAQNKKSIAVKLIMRSSEATLTEEGINALLKKILKALEKLNITQR